MRSLLGSLLLVCLLDAGLLGLLLRVPVAPVIHPLVPPLTRVEGLRDQPLGAGSPRPPARSLVHTVVSRVGTEDQRRVAAALVSRDAALAPLRARGVELRVAIEGRALALADLLGPERVARAIAGREGLAERYGEGRLWREAAAATGP